MQFVPQLFLYLFYIPALISSIIIAFILRKKYLKFGSFYQVFLVSGILDILHCFNYLFVHWVKFCYPSQLYDDTIKFTRFCDLLFSYTHFLYNCLMAANRFSATFMSYAKFWSAELVRIYIGSILGVSMISCIPVILEDPENMEYRVTGIGLTYEDIQRLILVVYAIFGDFFSIILTILTIHRIRHFATSQEKKLIIVTASHTILAIILLIYEITKMLKFSDPISIFLADYRKTIAYFGICFNFGTILIADSRVRQDFIEIFKLSNEHSVISVWSSDT